MGIYYFRDIAVDDDGDLQVTSGGDIKVANAAQSMKQAWKLMLATDYNEMKTQPTMGANLGSLIGNQDMREVLEAIPTMIEHGNNFSDLLNFGDYRVTAIPIDVNHIYISVEITGTYLDGYGNSLSSGTIYLEYTFPYHVEKIQALI